MKQWDICTKRTYTTKQGEEKTSWVKVGKMFQWDDGKYSGDLHALPMDSKLYFFEPRQRGEQLPEINTNHEPVGNSLPPAPEDDLPF